MMRLMLGILAGFSVGLALVPVGQWMLPISDAGHWIVWDFAYIGWCMVAMVVAVTVFDLIAGLGLAAGILRPQHSDVEGDR